MANNRTFGVNAFFIGADIGDAAIYILWSEGSDRKKKVERAVMVDGGSSFSSNYDSIYTAIKDIEDNFECQGEGAPYGGSNPGTQMRKRLQFNSFVVTHWDHDHYHGVMYFLIKDMNANASTLGRLSRALYSQNNTPRSTFYAPYWYRCARPSAGCGYPSAHKAPMNSFRTVDDKEKSMESTTTLQIKAGDWFEDMLLIRVGSDQLLGRDFFQRGRYHTKLDIDIRKSSKSFGDFMRRSRAKNLTTPVPAFYCVAVNMEVMGRKPLQWPDDDAELTYTNMSSICCLLAWHAPNDPNENNNFVSIYTAGDAPAVLEMAVAKWMQYNTGNKKSITLHKLSHHGSASSTPYELLPALKPKAIISMSGNNPRFSHPRWEVIFDIYGLSLYGDTGCFFDKSPLHLLRWPAYLRDYAFHLNNHKAGNSFYPRIDRARECYEEFLRKHNKLAKKRGLTDAQSEKEYPGVLRKIMNALAFDANLWGNRDKLTNIILFSLSEEMFPPLMADYAFLSRSKYNDYVLFSVSGTEGSSRITHKLRGPRGYMETDEPIFEYLRDLFGSSLNYRSRQASLSSISSWDCIEPGEASAHDADQVIAANSSPYHYLVPQKQKWSESNRTLSSTSIHSGNPLHEFVDHLPAGRIELVTQPDVETTKGPTPGSVRVALAPSDDWQEWLQLVLLVNTFIDKPSNGFELSRPELGVMYMEASEWPPTASTKFDFKFECVVKLKDGVEVSMVVDTSDAEKALSDPSREAINAMLSQSAIMPLGISMSTKFSGMSLGHVAELIHFPYSKTIQFLRQLPLKPANAADSGRTVMWYSAGQSRTTDLRLQFLLDGTIPDYLNSWLESGKFGITVKSFRVVARRSVYYRAGIRMPDTKALLDDGHSGLPDGRLSDDVNAFVRGEISFDISVVVAKLDFSLFITFDSKSVTFRLQRDGKGQGGDDLGTLLSWAYKSLGGRTEGENTTADQDYQNSTWGTCETWLKAAADLLGGVRPRVLEFSLDYDKDGRLQGVQGASITLQVELKVGKSGPIVVFVTFGWSRTRGASMEGELWSQPTFGDNIDYRSTLPLWESHDNLEPNGPKDVVDRVDLKDLLKLDSFPEGVPREITKATVSLDGSGMSVGAIVAAVYDDKKPPNMPRLTLDVLEVSLRRTWGVKGAPGSWDAFLGFSMLLFPLAQKPVHQPEKDPVAPYKNNVPCYIRGSINYQSGGTKALTVKEKQVSSWTLEASVSCLTIAHLAIFWDEGPVREAVMAMLSHITIEQLSLTYHFGPNDGDGGTDFKFIGVLKLGDLELDLDYHYNEEGWELCAGLIFDPATKGTTENKNDPSDDKGDPVTIQKVLEELLGQDSLPDIPGDVLKVPVGRPGNPGELLSFKCFLVKDKSKEEAKAGKHDILMTTLSIQISAISLTLIQWRNTSWAKNVLSKRVVKVALNEIGPVTAPLVGELKQPFEQLVYMWVSDKASSNINPKAPAKKGQKTAGITKAEFETLANKLTDADKLYFKPDAPDPEKISDKEFVIEAGSHFMVIAKDAMGEAVAVLDYVFGRPKPKTDKLILMADEKDKDPAKAPFKKSAGPLLIDNIGLTYDSKENRLGIALDATLLLGPIGLALLGFGVNVKLAKPDKRVEKDPENPPHNGLALLATKAAGLGSLPISDPQVTLEGLMVSFDRPPVTIAGGFARTMVDDIPYYAGGLIVGFVPWKLMAMGVYGQVPKPKNVQAKRGHRKGRSSVFKIIEISTDDEMDDLDFKKLEDEKKDSKPNTFTMVFVILKVEGPLFSIGFADISGLTAGVGVNSAIRLPTAETVLDFPFTKPSGTPEPSKGPLAALETVLRPPSKDVAPWFTPREGSFWIAAGLKVTAMTVLSADAVLVITTSPSVQIGIFGVAVVDVPSLASEVKFAHAELGIACVFDPEAGTFRFDAQLSPRSYVLHESCHLSGGMALYAWAKTGDFVMTLGGYHQAFVVPSAYPKPPRLRIAWSLGDHLRISGEAYFAVTARFCMGGGKLNATLNLGPLSAWFDAFLDFLINFKPFKFAADGGIAVGVRFSLDLWLVTVRINAEIKATLSVIGPPMAGRVHVDFWVFGFDIDFGDRVKALQEGGVSKLSLDGFKNLVLKGGGTAATGIPMPMDWVDVGRPPDDNVEGNEQTANTNTSERFLFNCTAGLLPNNNTNVGASSLLSSSSTKSSNVSWITAMFGDDNNIPENAWAVKAGELEFTITLAFAASIVIVKDNRKAAQEKEWSVGIEKAHQEIYALPMRLTGVIESTVEVNIDQTESDTTPFHVLEEEKRSEKRWFVKPIVKNVPKNLWGQYDPTTDPALEGNAVSSLLNAPKATGSVPLVMGLSFQPPLPSMSKDKVKKFNIVSDMLERVNNNGYPFKETRGVASDAWAPLAKIKYEDEWKRVKCEWEKDEMKDRADTVVRLWTDLMGWSKEDGKVLLGTRPSGMLTRFEDVIPAPPRIAAVAWKFID